MLILKKKLKKTTWIYEFSLAQNTRFFKMATPYMFLQYAECDLLSHSLACF